MANEEHTKDIHRYSYSRLRTFKECPQKHHYLYVEQIPEPKNEYLLKGSLFHQCVEAVLKGEEPDEFYKEWKDYVDVGLIHEERDLLEYMVNAYFSYYYKDYEKETTIAVEREYTDELEEGDYFVKKVDQLYENNSLLGVRDIKTTGSQLKYTHEDVLHNMQLLTYVRAVEKDLNRTVDFIEIDEVRLAKLAESVPLNKNGKPSTSLDTLSLVTAELYREEIENQQLTNEPKYNNVLALLEQRGHPLFRRTKVQLTNRFLLDSNDKELRNLYLGAAIDLTYRNKDRSRCFMCPYNRICELDENGGSEQYREQLVQILSN